VEAAQEFFHFEPAFDEFDGHFAIEFGIIGAINLSPADLACEREDFVTPDALARLTGGIRLADLEWSSLAPSRS
jgi:hypothetical protein